MKVKSEEWKVCQIELIEMWKFKKVKSEKFITTKNKQQTTENP